jgi:hypothetical protein
LQGSYRIKQVNRLRKKKLIDITFHRMERRSHFHCQSFGFLQTGRSKVHSRYSKALSGEKYAVSSLSCPQVYGAFALNRFILVII